MTVAFAGGGSMGPVTPLLAVYDRLKEQDPALRAFWFGTEEGPERAAVEERGIGFLVLPTAKWPRYLSKERFLFPWRYWRAVRLAKRVLRQERPDAVVSVGGFTAVPVVRVAAALGIPCVTHQLDRLPGLANRFLADRCVRVTSSFAYARPPFGAGVPVEQIPTPTRVSLEHLPARAQALRALGLDSSRPCILVMGGGTGAAGLNAFVERVFAAWTKRGWQIVHLAGRGKLGDGIRAAGVVQKEFCPPDGMPALYAAADVVVCRAGMGTLSEAVRLRKPLVLVPIPASHQEVNARPFADVEAAVVLAQDDPRFDEWVGKAVQRYLRDPSVARLAVDRAATLFPTDDGTALADIVRDAARGGEGAPFLANLDG